MGICWCKQKEEEHDTYVPQVDHSTSIHQATTTIQPISMTPNAPQNYLKASKIHPDPALVDKLVLETLDVIATLVDNEQDSPASMLLLHNIADNEEGFIQVVKSMIKVVPMYDPLGPSIITLLLDDCPLPSKESVFKVINMLNLSKTSAINGRTNPAREANICVVLGCIAETLAGPRNLKILNDSILDYLLTNLEPETDPIVVLFSLIALEKFAQSSQNKSTIIKRLERIHPYPINRLEKWRTETHYVKRQVGFCAQWVLDNLLQLTELTLQLQAPLPLSQDYEIFFCIYEIAKLQHRLTDRYESLVTQNRKYSYLTVNMEKINAMLNTSDVSEYLKISPDGLEARCDAYSFESVRCTAQADSGVWYYEVCIITPGVMQIGWATKNSNFLNHEGYGIGDDKYSLAYDGCRKLIWYNAKSEPQNISSWQSGDILGCFLDLNTLQIIFSINGMRLPPCTHVFTMAKSGFFAAASFMSFQQCRFNFGAEAFKYPPSVTFSTFNECGALTPEDKIVMPRHIFLNLLRQQNIREDSCTLCYDQKASVRLIPCEHSGFCVSCASQLVECPMCRAPFELVLEDSP